MAQAGRAKNGTTLNMLITKKKQEYQYKNSQYVWWNAVKQINNNQRFGVDLITQLHSIIVRQRKRLCSLSRSWVLMHLVYGDEWFGLIVVIDIDLTQKCCHLSAVECTAAMLEAARTAVRTGTV